MVKWTLRLPNNAIVEYETMIILKEASVMLRDAFSRPGTKIIALNDTTFLNLDNLATVELSEVVERKLDGSNPE